MTTIILAHPNQRCRRFQVFGVYDAPHVHHVFTVEEISRRDEAECVAHQMMEEYEQFMASWKASEGRQVATGITFNGHKYTSVEEMPPCVRREYEEAIAVLHGPATARSGTRFTEIIFNGRKYAGVEEMSADVRREYEGRLAKMNDADENQRVADAAPTPNEQVNYFCCRHCGKVVKAMESQGGMQGKCPACGEMTSIPYVGTAEETAGAEFVSTGAVHRHRHT